MQLTGLSLVIGLVLAVPVALARLADNPPLRWPAFGYMFYFRGTPLLVQIFLIYYGSGQFVPQLRALGLWDFFREPYFCAVLTLTLNTAAYTAEILRGAIRAVPYGEIEAARARHARWPAAAPDHPAQGLPPGAAGLHQRGHLPVPGDVAWSRSSRSWI